MLAADSGLVAGASAPAAVRTTVVRVVRPFFIAAERHERGEILDLDWRLAQELVTALKAERVTTEPAPPEPPALLPALPAEPAGQPVEGGTAPAGEVAP